jgi:IS1 family transposase/transposase-like protein
MIACPQCSNTENIVKNGKKYNKSQNYLCKKCFRQFISRNELINKGCDQEVRKCIIRCLSRGSGIRDTAYITQTSIGLILKILCTVSFTIKPKKQHYQGLEIDELWTYVQKKATKVWIIYLYCKETKEIVAYIHGKRDRATVKKLWNKVKKMKIKIDSIYSDGWEAFRQVFSPVYHFIGKEFTKSIEGNNCLLRIRMRRIFRKTCNFSKKLFNHLKAFELVVYNINVLGM